MRFATLALALALTGCAQLQKAPPAAADEAHLSGRISVTIAGDVHNRGTGGGEIGRAHV